MRLSYIIPVYNAERHIRPCLDALARQGLPADAFEILIVNDGSTDGTLAEIEATRGLVPQVRVLQAERLGPGGARNLAIEQARGDRIWFVDVDDIPVPGAARALLGMMDEQGLDFLSFEISRQPAGTALSALSPFDGSARPGPVRDGRGHLASERMRGECWWYLSSRALHVGGPRFIPRIFCADSLFTPQLILRASRAAHMDAVAYIYMLSDTSITRRSDPGHLAKMADSMLLVAGELRQLVLEQAAAGAPPAVVRTLMGHAETLVFFLHVRLLRHAPSLGLIRRTHAQARAAGLVPFRHFGRPEYPGRRFMLLRFCINTPGLYPAAGVMVRAWRRLRSLFARA